MATAAEVIARKYQDLTHLLTGQSVIIREKGRSIKEFYHIGHRIDIQNATAYA
jgi:hypothetical protein